MENLVNGDKGFIEDSTERYKAILEIHNEVIEGSENEDMFAMLSLARFALRANVPSALEAAKTLASHVCTACAGDGNIGANVHADRSKMLRSFAEDPF